MRLAFDGTAILAGRTGVGYYAEHLLQALREIVGSEHQIFVLSHQPDQFRAIFSDGPPVLQAPRFFSKLLWTQMVAPLALRREGVQLAHFTNGVVPLIPTGQSVVTIHDLSLMRHPDMHPRYRVLQRLLSQYSVRRAEKVVTVSHTMAKEIRKWRPVPSRRVEVIPAAPAPWFRAVEAEVADTVLRRHQLPDRFFLFVGRAEPRKNLSRLVSAFEVAKRQKDVPDTLVIVGPPGWGKDGLSPTRKGQSSTGTIRVLGYLPAADLVALYTACTAFVYPSLYEGFGIPVAEAMACGAPVITSRNTAMAEVADEAAILVNARDAQDLARALVTVATDEELRQDLKRRSQLRSEAFCWKRSAQKLLQIYQKVVSNGN